MDQQSEDYLSEIEQRVDVLAQWASSYWPRIDAPLAVEEFIDVKHVFIEFVRSKLAAVEEFSAAPAASNTEPQTPEEGAPQYVNMNPAPWP